MCVRPRSAGPRLLTSSSHPREAHRFVEHEIGVEANQDHAIVPSCPGSTEYHQPSTVNHRTPRPRRNVTLRLLTPLLLSGSKVTSPDVCLCLYVSPTTKYTDRSTRYLGDNFLLGFIQKLRLCY
ncbi:hypothetical protein KQX54_019915 [Cotesia glomerata]|uniref:Uncharacterized protein n=1 Tax=Cotesia glomerata TaxID=32391 RepID=A0AAV7I0Q4_COTGL|nr:hypothetical protein KQX54_019915 [Cotesia glomerata]